MTAPTAMSEEGVRVRDIAEAIGRRLGVPTESRLPEDLGMPLGAVLGADMPASSVPSRQPLSWEPTHPGLVDDIEHGHYFD